MRKVLLVIVAFVFYINISSASSEDKVGNKFESEQYEEISPLKQNPYVKPRRRKTKSEYRKKSIWENRVNFGFGMNWNNFSGIKTESKNSGYAFDASYYHFIIESLGIGMETNLNKCLFDNGDFSYEDKATTHVIDQDLKHQTSMFFVGPSIMTRTTAASNYLVFYAAISAGYASCNMIDRNNTPNKYDLSFNGLGVLWKAGVDISIAENVYFNVGGSYFRTSSKTFNSLLNGANHEFTLKDGLGIKYNNFGVNFGLVLSF
ncbi:hypothetical protein K5X82_06355 [Halosquirtibacter xylanolyticus]|uniref:hypothetical protein n=1 Tax=Halosquirtibacter xylanolyticus TaxID=3374599 RepID=UPI00374A22D3|nr:hypothetical protein K5X82_06355 [Prolixibacteraceae bacterium]